MRVSSSPLFPPVQGHWSKYVLSSSKALTRFPIGFYCRRDVHPEHERK